MYRLLNVFVVCTECMCPVHNQYQPKVMYGTRYKQTCLICSVDRHRWQTFFHVLFNLGTYTL